MKCIILGLALIGAASAAVLTPYTRGYSNVGWGHAGFGVPAVTAYSSPIVSSVYNTPLVASVAPSYAASTFNAHAITAPLLTGHTIASPALTNPLISAYHAGPTIIPASTALGHGGYIHGDLLQGGLIQGGLIHGDLGLGYNGWDVEFLKKKKKAAH